MATSGTTIWQLSRDQIISAALRKLGVIGEGVSANATQISEGAEALNGAVLELQGLGMQLWSRQTYNLTLITGQPTYTFGVGQAINTPYPLKVLQANMKVAGTSVIDMDVKSSYDFKLLPPNSTGLPVSVMYKPQINTGVLSVWPTPNASIPAGTVLALTYQRPLEIYTAGTETPDFPQEWSQALIYHLATLLADEYGMPIQDKQWMEKQAEKHITTAVVAGTEESSVFFYPDKRG